MRRVLADVLESVSEGSLHVSDDGSGVCFSSGAVDRTVAFAGESDGDAGAV